jgi:hypothetical protein
MSQFEGDIPSGAKARRISSAFIPVRAEARTLQTEPLPHVRQAIFSLPGKNGCRAMNRDP